MLLTLRQFYKERGAKSIVGFGAGQCPLIALLRTDGFEALGVDREANAAPFMRKAELGEPLYLNKLFDYAQSFGETVPSNAENFFFANLARHAAKGIVMNWSEGGENAKQNSEIIAKVEAYNSRKDLRLRPKFRSGGTVYH